MNATNIDPSINESAPRKPFRSGLFLVVFITICLAAGHLFYRFALKPLWFEREYSAELVRAATEPKLFVTIRAEEYRRRQDAAKVFEEVMHSLKLSGWTDELAVPGHEWSGGGFSGRACRSTPEVGGGMSFFDEKGNCMQTFPFDYHGSYRLEFIVTEFGDSTEYQMKAVYQDGYEAADPPGLGYRPSSHIDMTGVHQRYYWREASRTLYEVRGRTNNYRLEDDEAAKVILRSDVVNLLVVLAEKRQTAK